ncbi:fructose-bisphosphatase class III [Streptococcus pseudoporcinus]|uniref:fructose-bisphosphatase class III n=1 Tax=Streptococcus pseudoporcinus TaxID=361101 RepID=UPI0022B95DBE|nr:fructose-bisphosphatase class III [Streptococcus pseudoporcinus]
MVLIYAVLLIIVIVTSTKKPFFNPILDGDHISESERLTLNKLQQATALLQFKLEHQLIKRRPEFGMEAWQLFSKIDPEKKTIKLGKKVYPLQSFPYHKLVWDHAELLTEEEEQILKGTHVSFSKFRKIGKSH